MKRSIFIDTNILMDVFGRREPFYQHSASVLALSENGNIAGHISAISYNNSYYLLRRFYDHSAARKKMVALRNIVVAVSLDQQIINQAIDSEFTDFEDAIQYFSALHIHADCIITRNKKHFSHSEIPIFEPSEFLKLI